MYLLKNIRYGSKKKTKFIYCGIIPNKRLKESVLKNGLD